MKRVLLSIVAPALLVALGFAQIPAAGIKTDETNIKGCLGGSDGNYTVAEDKTGYIFKVTTNSVDLKQHLGHEVSLIGHRAGGVSSAAADHTFAVTELNMISEHCAAAPAAIASTSVETPLRPTATDAPAATVSAPAETTVIPAVTAAEPTATVLTPAEIVIAPAVVAAAPAATVTTPAETPITTAVVLTPPADTADIHAAPASHPTRLPAPAQRGPVAAAAVATPAATASTPPEPGKLPDAAATPPAATTSTSLEPVSTPAAADTTPACQTRILMAFDFVSRVSNPPWHTGSFL